MTEMQGITNSVETHFDTAFSCVSHNMFSLRIDSIELLRFIVTL